MPIRMGSFNVKTDPDGLPRGVSLAKGVVLDDAALAAIRQYLAVNRPPRFSAELVEQCRAALAEERSALLGRKLAVDGDDGPAAYERALAETEQALIARARALAQEGHTLSSKRSQATTAASGASPLDELQAHANYIRLALFPAFEAACKEAGLMVRRRPKRLSARSMSAGAGGCASEGLGQASKQGQ